MFIYMLMAVKSYLNNLMKDLLFVFKIIEFLHTRYTLLINNHYFSMEDIFSGVYICIYVYKNGADL